MARFMAGGAGGPDYVQPDEPSNPEVAELWYDTDADPDGDGTNEGEYLIYGSDGNWHPTGYVDHRNLTNVVEDSHHQYPVPTTGIAADAVTAAKIAAGAVGPTQAALGPGLQGDGSGNIAVDGSQVDADKVDGNDASDLAYSFPTPGSWSSFSNTNVSGGAEFAQVVVSGSDSGGISVTLTVGSRSVENSGPSSAGVAMMAGPGESISWSGNPGFSASGYYREWS